MKCLGFIIIDEYANVSLQICKKALEAISLSAGLKMYFKLLGFAV